jgi:type II secretory pathway pseudopilin PulG
MNKRKNKWMLLKLLVAIIIIAIFYALVMPPVISIQPGHAKEIKSKTMAVAIVIAIRQYESTYGALPYGEDKAKKDTIVGDEYDELIELLSCVDGPDKGDDVTENGRRIKFLEFPRDFEEKGFLDPWGQKFKIYIDTNYDGNQMVGNRELNGSVLVYSYGKNKKDDKGQEDDICTWE